VTGILNPSDFINRMITGIILLGCYPDTVKSGLCTCEYTPVDYVSKAIVHLSLQGSAEKVFHITSKLQRTALLVEAVQGLGYNLKEVKFEEFLGNLLDEEENPLFTLAANIENGAGFHFQHQFDDFRTTRALKTTSKITCPPLDIQLLQTYVRFCIDQKLVPPPEEMQYDDFI